MTDEDIRLSKKKKISMKFIRDVLMKRFPKGFKSRKGTDYLNYTISYDLGACWRLFKRMYYRGFLEQKQFNKKKGDEGGERYFYVPLNLSEEDRMLRIKKIQILAKL